MFKAMDQENGKVVATQHPVLIQGINNIGQAQAFYISFLKGQPKALGVVLICMILIQLSLAGLLIVINTSTSTSTLYSGINFWGSAFYLIAAGLTLAAESKQSRCLVGGALGMHIFCSIISISEVILIIFDCLFYFPDYTYECDYQYLPSQCSEYLRTIYEIRLGILIILIVVSALQFSIALSISVIACTSLCQPIRQPQVYVINNSFGFTTNPETSLP